MDKTIGELSSASTPLSGNELFILEQNSSACKLSGAKFLDYLVDPVTKKVDMHGGIKDITQNEDYSLTITCADGESYIVKDVRGPQGPQGIQGRSIVSIVKDETQSSGLIDVYTINYSDGDPTTFSVTNGSSIKEIVKGETTGLKDTYNVKLTSGASTPFYVTNGRGISSITCDNDPSGQVEKKDTYTITFNDDTTYSFSVQNGKNGGSGTGSAVTSINGKDGTVNLTGEDIQVSSTDTTTLSASVASISTLAATVSTLETAVAERQPETSTLDDVVEAADDDAFPLYDVSEKKNRKMSWLNIVTAIAAKVRSAFQTTALTVDSGGTGAKDAATARANLGAADATTVDASLAAIKAGGLNDKAISRAKLANEVNYGTVVLVTSETTVQSSWHEAFVYVTNSDEESLNISLDGTTQDSLDAGWRCRLYAGKEFTFTWSGITSNLIDSESGLYGTSGTITVPANKYLDLRKTLDGIWTAFGNYSTAQRVILSNKIIYPANWESNTTYADYPYRGTINAANVVYPEMIPEVIFSLADSTSGKFAPIADTDYGVIYIYATEMPTENMTIPTIILWR